jgi:hypothetical protein
MQQTLISILAGLIIAFFTSWITVRFALKQFFSERWWERKADAYSKIVEALYHIKNVLQVDLELEEQGKSISKERFTKLVQKANVGYEELYKAEGIGAFVISKEVTTSLTQLKSNLKKEEKNFNRSYTDFLDSQVFHLNKCLDEIRLYAKRDLKI